MSSPYKYNTLALLVAVLCGFFHSTGVYAAPLDHLATPGDIGLHKIPHTGTSHILIIPSRAGLAEFPEARWNELQQIFAKEGGPGTFRNYWRTVSNGRYDPIPFLIDPVLYPDSCPLPSKTLANCTIGFSDTDLLADQELKTALTTMFERVRSEQGVDFRDFDINSKGGAGPDGYFDGIILDTDLFSGIAFPLAVFGNSVTVGANSADDSSLIECGIAALIPPANHEFGHLLGFIDHYGGPTLNGLAADKDTDLSAFSRQQLGWADIVVAQYNQTLTLRPVLEGGSIVRFGESPTYVLLENRGGTLHSQVSSVAPGANWYTIDEDALPFGLLGFISGNDLYLPNAEPPYLNVNLPINCLLADSNTDNGCVLPSKQTMRVVHGSGTDLGFSVELGEVQADGSIEVTITSDLGDKPDEPDTTSSGGCSSHSGHSTILVSLVLLLAWNRQRNPLQ